MGNKFEKNLMRAGAYEEMQKADKIQRRALVWSIIVGFISILFIYPVHAAIFSGSFSAALENIGQYFWGLMTDFLPSLKFFIIDWIMPPSVEALKNHRPQITWALPLVMGFVTFFVLKQKGNGINKTPDIFGDARFATPDDIKLMEDDDLVSLEKGHLMVLGYLQKKRKFRKPLNQKLQLMETVSTLLLAPPGSGKTVGFVVPSIIEMDSTSLFVFDLKPEIFDMTAGHRQRLGPVFKIAWNAENKPDGDWIYEEYLKKTPDNLLERDDRGNLIFDETRQMYKTKSIFYPSWNPLSPANLPRSAQARDLYIDNLASVICPDTKEDKFWTSSARKGLIGMIYYVIGKAAEEDYNGIPDDWHGKEPSFPMLVDWYSDAQINATEGDDPLADLFRSAAEEVKASIERSKTAGEDPKYPERCAQELIALMNSPDRTRGSILATLEGAVAPFRQASVRQRVQSSDFTFDMLRGVPTAAAVERERIKAATKEHYKPKYSAEDYVPITVYICVSLQDMAALATITGVFIESANTYLVANPPNSIDDHGRRTGPYPFGFVLDEAPQMPKLESTIINGPATGRGQKVFYIIVGQEFAQFEQKYSAADVESIITNTAVKVVLTQNNDKTAKRVSDMIGRITYQKESYSDGGGGGGGSKGNGWLADGWKGSKKKKKSKSESFESVELMSASKLMSMPKGEHLVLVQSHMKRPIKCKTPRFFEYPELSRNVFNMRTLEGPQPPLPMPQDYLDRAIENYEISKDVKEAKVKDNLVIIVTPQDINVMRSAAADREVPLETVFVAGEIEMPKDADGCPDVKDEDILVTSDPKALSDFCRGKRVLVFDRNSLRLNINPVLDQAGVRRIAPEICSYISDLGEDTRQAHIDSIQSMAENGSARLTLPADAALITPEYALGFTIDLFDYLVSTKALMIDIRKRSDFFPDGDGGSEGGAGDDNNDSLLSVFSSG